MSSTINFHHPCAAAVAGALLAVSGPTLAAESSLENRPLTGHVDAGYVMTDDTTSDFLDDDWMLEAGLNWRPDARPFALRADLRYLDLDMDEDIVQLGGAPSSPARVDDGDARIVGSTSARHTISNSPIAGLDTLPPA